MPPSFYCGLLFFAWLLLLSSIWRIVRIPTATTTTIQSTTLNSVRTATPALKAAYTTLVQYVKTQHGPEWNVVLIGNDPCSISASEGGPQGLRSDAPWAMDLWRNSRPSTWENPYFDKPDGWKSERVPLHDVYVNMSVSYTTRYNITSINDLFVDSTSFILSPVGLKSKVRAAIALWNDLAVRAYINEFYVASWTKNTQICKKAKRYQKILHTIGIVNNTDIATLKSWGYGVSYDNEWTDGMQVYSKNRMSECPHKWKPGDVIPTKCEDEMTTATLYGAKSVAGAVWGKNLGAKCWQVHNYCGGVENVCDEYFWSVGVYHGCHDYCLQYQTYNCGTQ